MEQSFPDYGTFMDYTFSTHGKLYEKFSRTPMLMNLFVSLRQMYQFRSKSPEHRHNHIFFGI